MCEKHQWMNDWKPFKHSWLSNIIVTVRVPPYAVLHAFIHEINVQQCLITSPAPLFVSLPVIVLCGTPLPLSSFSAIMGVIFSYISNVQVLKGLYRGSNVMSWIPVLIYVTHFFVRDVLDTVQREDIFHSWSLAGPAVQFLSVPKLRYCTHPFH